MKIPAVNDRVQIEYRGQSEAALVDDVREDADGFGHLVQLVMRRGFQIDQNDKQFYWITANGKAASGLHGFAKQGDTTKIVLRWLG